MTAADEEKYDDGYDSDGDVGPFFDAVNNGPDEEELLEKEGESLPVSMGGLVPPEEEPKKEYQPPTCDLKKLTVQDLKYELMICGLAPKGKKASLRQMLEDAMEKNVAVGAALFNTSQMEKKRDNMLSGFPSTTNWELIKHNEHLVDKPTNPLYVSTSNSP